MTKLHAYVGECWCNSLRALQRLCTPSVECFGEYCMHQPESLFRDYHRKRDKLKALKRKALDKNPDEFYFSMVNTRLEVSELSCFCRCFCYAPRLFHALGSTNHQCATRLSLCCQDGVHQCKDETPIYTDEQLKLMTSQDIKYVNYKCSIELKVLQL